MSTGTNPAPGFLRNPDRRIGIEPFKGTVTVRAADAVLAASANAKLLSEEGYPPVIYIPFDDIAFASLERTATSTHCPYKGNATYWRLASANDPGDDVMWAYEAPYDEMVAIKNHGAFYPDRVAIETG